MPRIQATISSNLENRLKKATDLHKMMISEIVRAALTAYLKGLGV